MIFVCVCVCVCMCVFLCVCVNFLMGKEGRKIGGYLRREGYGVPRGWGTDTQVHT